MAEINFIDMLIPMANEKFDSESFGKSETYAGILQNLECMLTYPDEGSDEAIAYWAKRGLKKELHDTGTQATKWASYLPTSIESEPDPGKVYPLLFVMHGANNPIYLAEGYGYTHIAAREKMIVIIPENETPESIDKLFCYAREHFPVDWTRVYMVGYSLGGFMTSRHALRDPERFAAVGVGGMIFGGGTAGSIEQAGITWHGEEITETMIDNAAKVKMPICSCMGEQEFLNLAPITEGGVCPPLSPDNQAPAPFDLTPKAKIAALNNWRKIAGCKPFPEDKVFSDVKASADIVVEKLGFPFERTRVINTENRSHYVGDCVNSDGDNLARFVCIEKSPHWPSAALTEITWDFIKRFSRDPETGLLSYSNN